MLLALVVPHSCGHSEMTWLCFLHEPTPGELIATRSLKSSPAKLLSSSSAPASPAVWNSSILPAGFCIWLHNGHGSPSPQPVWVALRTSPALHSPVVYWPHTYWCPSCPTAQVGDEDKDQYWVYIDPGLQLISRKAWHLEDIKVLRALSVPAQPFLHSLPSCTPLLGSFPGKAAWHAPNQAVRGIHLTFLRHLHCNNLSARFEHYSETYLRMKASRDFPSRAPGRNAPKDRKLILCLQRDFKGIAKTED